MHKPAMYRVELGARSYDIHIEPGCLDRLGEAMRRLFPSQDRCLVVSNDVVAPLYLRRVRQTLESKDWEVSEAILADGERHKNLEAWSSILDAMMASRLSREEPVIALGGGVVGDMAGFAAACYRRGVPFVQAPTTLLAQVDSSVGGKTAINHPHGKNMIGAFFQPRLVWIDPEVLSTLPERELKAGIAELIKYGLIRDAGFFAYLEKHASKLLCLRAEVVAQVIHQACRHKAEVVMADETEQGQRALLNLGHTFGHALESMTHYQKFLHGEAVAIGTLMAARLSKRLGFASDGLETRIRELYTALGLETETPDFTPAQWLDAMGHDKKNVGRHIRYILLKGIGDAFIADDVQSSDIEALLGTY